MDDIGTEILRRGTPRFNMVGQRLPDTLHNTGEVISPGLVARLHRYGRMRMTSAGFAVDGWKCSIYTMDGDLRVGDRAYCVEFTNAKGGMVGVQGILFGRGGHPCLDHGLSIGEDRANG